MEITNQLNKSGTVRVVGMKIDGRPVTAVDFSLYLELMKQASKQLSKAEVAALRQYLTAGVPNR